MRVHVYEVQFIQGVSDNFMKRITWMRTGCERRDISNTSLIIETMCKSQ